MENKRNDKRAFLITAVLFGLLTLTIIILAASDYSNTHKKEGIVVFFVAIILAVFGIKVLRDKYESLKRGEPLKDERSRKIETKASAVAFLIGIYWLLALGFAIDEFKLGVPASSVPNVGIAGMAVIFGLAYWYFSRKGE